METDRGTKAGSGIQGDSGSIPTAQIWAKTLLANDRRAYSESSVGSLPPLFAATTAGAITIPMKASAIKRSCIAFLLTGSGEPAAGLWPVHTCIMAGNKRAQNPTKTDPRQQGCESS